MNIFRATMTASLIFIATAPMYGMWQKGKGIVPDQLNLTTKAMIGAAIVGTALEALTIDPLNGLCRTIAQSSHPGLLRMSILLNATMITSMLIASLKKDSDFWNRDSIRTKFLVFFNAYLSCTALRMGYIALSQ